MFFLRAKFEIRSSNAEDIEDLKENLFLNFTITEREFAKKKKTLSNFVRVTFSTV